MLIDLMAIAHGCDPYGFLMSNGHPIPPETITKLLGIRPQTYRKHIANLSERSRVATADNGALYIPRMVKDAEYASKQAAFGKRGGNPTLKGQKNQTLKLYTEVEVDKSKTPLSPPAGGNGVGLETIYQAYPRHVAKQAAIKAIKSAIKSGQTPEYLLERVQAFANATAEWGHEHRQYIPHPATWFNGGRYDDNPREWTRDGSDPDWIPAWERGEEKPNAGVESAT